MIRIPCLPNSQSNGSLPFSKCFNNVTEQLNCDNSFALIGLNLVSSRAAINAYSSTPAGNFKSPKLPMQPLNSFSSSVLCWMFQVTNKGHLSGFGLSFESTNAVILESGILGTLCNLEYSVSKASNAYDFTDAVVDVDGDIFL
ncbi:unnamed protein product [Ambrosiozyma monospora]|uniref:Unnamed protein product n=1 Tax=Ambrosiozyma monospora TaxID=43982 RepID=A0ACB5U149_AMBMO|nr:unnamed protein product [Ambrosiozyma monospora]